MKHYFILLLCSIVLQGLGLCCQLELLSIETTQAHGPGVLTCRIHNFINISDVPLALENSSHTAFAIPSSFHREATCGLSTGTLTIFSFFDDFTLKLLAQLITNAFMELLKYYRWTHFIILSSSSHRFYVKAGQYLYENALETNFLAVDYFQLNDAFTSTDVINKLSNQNKRIIILSMPSQKVQKILSMADCHGWRDYLWIAHSIYKQPSHISLYNGVMELQAKADCSEIRIMKDILYNMQCRNFTQLEPSAVEILIQINNELLHLANYSKTTGLNHIAPGYQFPNDTAPQYLNIMLNVIFYLVLAFFFLFVSCTVILYIFYRNKPAIKATSSSLSSLIFIGCYTWIFYLCILNFTLPTSYHKQPSFTRNAVCLMRMWLNGLGYPVVLIVGTTLVKMIRIYRIFYFSGKLNVYLCSNFALALYALVLTVPNIIICLLWLLRDPYQSKIRVVNRNGRKEITEICQSMSAIQYLLGLLIHIVILGIALFIVAVKTRSIQLKDFKDSTKIIAFSFWFLLTATVGLSYWFILSTIEASSILLHISLQISHYFLIFQCLAFLFMPKLCPILKQKYRKKRRIPVSKK